MEQQQTLKHFRVFRCLLVDAAWGIITMQYKNAEIFTLRGTLAHIHSPRLIHESHECEVTHP